MIEWGNIIASVFGAVVGGTLTGYFSVKATKSAYHHQRQIQSEKQDAIIKGLLQAIHDEVETLWNNYSENIGCRIEALQENNAFISIYPITQDYFTVYNGNSFLIGHIPDNDLRKEIVTTYTLGKGLIDSYKLNNDLIIRHENILTHIDENNPRQMEKARSQFQSLVDYASSIKKDHYKLKTHVENLLRMLRKKGVLSEKMM